MINACNDCGNAIEECTCIAPDETFYGRPNTIEMTPLSEIELVQARLAIAPTRLTPVQADSIGKAAFLAFWGGSAPYDWETTSNRSNWIAAGKAAALQHVKNRL